MPHGSEEQELRRVELASLQQQFANNGDLFELWKQHRTQTLKDAHALLSRQRAELADAWMTLQPSSTHSAERELPALKPQDIDLLDRLATGAARSRAAFDVRAVVTAVLADTEELPLTERREDIASRLRTMTQQTKADFAVRDCTGDRTYRNVYDAAMAGSSAFAAALARLIVHGPNDPIPDLEQTQAFWHVRANRAVAERNHARRVDALQAEAEKLVVSTLGLTPPELRDDEPVYDVQYRRLRRIVVADAHVKDAVLLVAAHETATGAAVTAMSHTPAFIAAMRVHQPGMIDEEGNVGKGHFSVLSDLFYRQGGLPFGVTSEGAFDVVVDGASTTQRDLIAVGLDSYPVNLI